MAKHRPNKIYTARALAGDWWWDEEYYAVRAKGTVKWDAAYMRSHSRRVRLARLDPVQLCGVIVYVDPETPMKLVKK